MEITNASNVIAKVVLEEEFFLVSPGETVELKNVDSFYILHTYESYCCEDSGSSKILKWISVLDDPFKLRKNYHIVITSFFNKMKKFDSEQIVIIHKQCYVDVDTQTYYDFFILTSKNEKIRPNRMFVSDLEKILQNFKINEKKLTKWNAIWNILIEPIILEVIGFIVIYKLFSVWFGKGALYIVLFFVILILLVEIIATIFKKNNKKILVFEKLINETNIQNFFSKEV